MCKTIINNCLLVKSKIFYERKTYISFNTDFNIHNIKQVKFNKFD